ncbi:MAG: hypothetical protein IID44_22860 [Planctomycetes bacterium]|nr:hypothetical protein [Planctomycetota bacterium]
MTAKLNDDLQRAVDAASGQPLRAEHERSHKVYFIYNEEMHERASIALQEQNDLDAIGAGIDDMEAGRLTPVAEADTIMRKRLGFPASKQ